MLSSLFIGIVGFAFTIQKSCKKILKRLRGNSVIFLQKWLIFEPKTKNHGWDMLVVYSSILLLLEFISTFSVRPFASYPLLIIPGSQVFSFGDLYNSSGETV